MRQHRLDDETVALLTLCEDKQEADVFLRAHRWDDERIQAFYDPFVTVLQRMFSRQELIKKVRAVFPKANRHAIDIVCLFPLPALRSSATHEKLLAA